MKGKENSPLGKKKVLLKNAVCDKPSILFYTPGDAYVSESARDFLTKLPFYFQSGLFS